MSRIGIMTDALGGPLSGTATYVRSLVSGLPRCPEFHNHKFTLVHGGLPNHPEYSEYDDVTVRHRYRPWPWEFSRTHWLLPRAIQKAGIDLLHSTTQRMPVRPSCSYATVLTVLDLVSTFGMSHKLRWRPIKRWVAHDLWFKWACRQADRILTLSDSTRQDVIKWSGVEERKVVVAHCGCGPEFKPIHRHHFPEDVQRILSEKLPKKFILYLGTFEPRKNVLGIVKAFARLKSETGLPHRLVLAGREDRDSQTIRKAARELGVLDEIVFLGFVPEKQLPFLYNLADVFVFPSFCEGFGLPVLEAMACGTPVITSNVSSLPEVVGDAGVTVSPSDVDSLSEAMVELLKRNEMRSQLSQRGLERAKMFKWENMASITLRVYEEVLSERYRSTPRESYGNAKA